MERERQLLTMIRAVAAAALAITGACVMVSVVVLNPELLIRAEETPELIPVKKTGWSPPGDDRIPSGADGDRIRYGRELIAHTASYLGPEGSVARITNGMNCQNCHLEAGTKRMGNNYAGVASTYPKFRARSGTVESVEKRVNDCIERSLNGKALEAGSAEMLAMVTYIKWVGTDVPKDSIPKGTGIKTPVAMDRAADPVKGAVVFTQHCSRCHGNNGEGQREAGQKEWRYPPLYGKDSYNTGAGLFRLSRFAGYVKYNMPNDLATADKPFLTDEECWDVAAYVNSMPRPTKDLSADWPDISKKPFDHPFGPYADVFTEREHKFGPFKGRVK
ncbi:MAG: c-type cytochrome [Bacteroidota bacterium]